MALKQEFMHTFHNISRIMDCVGCESCKASSSLSACLLCVGFGVTRGRHGASGGGRGGQGAEGGGWGVGWSTIIVTPPPHPAVIVIPRIPPSRPCIPQALQQSWDRIEGTPTHRTVYLSHAPPPPPNTPLRFPWQLWGKLETLGLGTALKIMLFSSDEEGKKELASLSRNELIALVNTAAQLSKSVGSVPEWRWLGNERNATRRLENIN